METLSLVMKMAVFDMIFGSFHLIKPTKFASFSPTTRIPITHIVVDTTPLCLQEYIGIRGKDHQGLLALEIPRPLFIC